MAETLAADAALRTARSRPRIMGVLNVTPDSFSDGGAWKNLRQAIAHGVELREHGAEIVDVGGESTRPGAERVSPGQEQVRVLPVIEGLVALGIPVSVDTMNASTAALATEAGAGIINDVSGGLADPEMYRVVAETGRDYVAMHWRGHSEKMNELAVYTNVVREVRTELKARISELIVWGVQPERIIVDPGLGFAKTAEHNWQLLGHLDELVTLGHRVLVGASRKRFLAEFAPDGAPASDRDAATATVSALAAQSGAWAVRVHDVQSTMAALKVWTAWENGAHE
jgi:dihydropteroate synthase